jgi:catechol 2,3-dioxygenase-like lactoylglutathione lyase family enzyme
MTPSARESSPRSALAAIALLLAMGPVAARADSAADRQAPVAVSGIAGATFLTADMDAMRRFYGRGTGFAEVQVGPGRTRFLVGTHQWVEFQTAPDPNWPRRLQYVTLEAPDLGDLERILRGRGVPVEWIGADPHTRVLQLLDPAGNRIRVAEPRTAPMTASVAAGFSEHLQHFGLAVDRSQAEATMAFYRDTLGWPEAVRMAGPDGRTAMVKYRLPGPRNELVELILFNPPLNKWASGAFDHVNFEVGDIDATYRALRRGGIATQDKHLPKVNGEHLWAIDIIDPELTRMEVQVLAPTEAPIGTVSAGAAGAVK